MAQAFEIRRVVFVIGQNVPLDREIDGLDDISEHYLVYAQNKPDCEKIVSDQKTNDGDTPDEMPCATARIRLIDNAVRIERLAVLPEFQGKGIGRALLIRIIEDCRSLQPKEIFMHAQIQLMDFYTSLGFKKRGHVFMDAGIVHIEMYMK
jgi:predicted GNAT family N-acyltransferase